MLEEFQNIKFNKNRFSGTRVLACGQTDSQSDGRQTK